MLYRWKHGRDGVEAEERGVVRSEMNKLRMCVHHGTTYKAHRCKRRHASQDRVDCFDCGAENHSVSGPRGPRRPDAVDLIQRVSRELKSSHLGDISLLLSLKKRQKNKHVAVLYKCPARPLLVFVPGVSDRAKQVLSSFATWRGDHPLVKPRREAGVTWFRWCCSIPHPHPRCTSVLSFLTSALTSQHYGCYTWNT